MPSIKKFFSLKAFSKTVKPSKRVIISEPTHLVKSDPVFPNGTPYPYEWTRECRVADIARHQAFMAAIASSKPTLAPTPIPASTPSAILTPTSPPKAVVWDGIDGWRFQECAVRHHRREAASWEESETAEEDEEEVEMYADWVVPVEVQEEMQVDIIQKQGERVWWA